MSALILAVAKDQREVIKKLLDAGANVNLQEMVHNNMIENAAFPAPYILWHNMVDSLGF